jgi:putative endonuclease
MFYVYLLKSLKDNKYYIGQTDNVFRRLEEHNKGKNISTRNRRPLILVGCEEFLTRNEARYREYELKKKPRKKKIFIEKVNKLNEKGKN